MEGGVLPVTGFPHDGDKVKEGNVHRQIEHGASTSNSYIASIRSRTLSQGYTFEACKRDNSRSVKVEEVDVLATAVVEVVVLARSRVDGRGSRDLGDGSGTCLSLHEFP